MNRTLGASSVLAITALLAHPAAATVYGIKSCGSSSIGVCGTGQFVDGDASLPPANLFSLDSGVVTDLGAITVGGTSVDADGLAMRADGALFGFELFEDVTASSDPLRPGVVSTVTGSQLISLGSGSAVATEVGSTFLGGRDVRGAVFDAAGNLWVVDAAADQLLRIDVASGAEVTGSAVDLTLAGGAFDVGFSTDLAIRADGSAWLSSGSDVYALDLGTGTLSASFSSSDINLAGLAFDPMATASLFGYDVSGADDLYAFDTSLPGSPRTDVALDILASFNAGRGDLASITLADTPEPGSLALLALALAGFGASRHPRLQGLAA